MMSHLTALSQIKKNLIISVNIQHKPLRHYHLRIEDDLEYAQLFPCFPHEPLLLWTHVRTRPHKHLRHVQVFPQGLTCADNTKLERLYCVFRSCCWLRQTAVRVGLTLTQDLVSLLQEAVLVLGCLSHLANEVEEGGGDLAL